MVRLIVSSLSKDISSRISISSLSDRWLSLASLSRRALVSSLKRMLMKLRLRCAGGSGGLPRALRASTINASLQAIEGLLHCSLSVEGYLKAKLSLLADRSPLLCSPLVKQLPYLGRHTKAQRNASNDRRRATDLGLGQCCCSYV